jgi:hypothetical protein
MQLIPSIPTAKGPGDRFTGDVYLNTKSATGLEPVTDQDYETAHTGL